MSAYVKKHSFQEFSVKADDRADPARAQAARASASLTEALIASRPLPEREVLKSVRADLAAGENGRFKITAFIAAEMEKLRDADLPPYLFHRYRYDVWPAERKLDDYPPYLQLEPVSYCNYRCTFCFQTDRKYFKKNAENMGVMDPGLFREVLEEAAGKVEFFSIASRGEPLLHPEFGKLMAAVKPGRFLGLKINTNAAVLDDEKSRAILESGVSTLVYSADAATPALYAKLRVGGQLSRVQKNIERFQEIRAKEYPGSKIITRVSGVRVSSEQSIESMRSYWGSLADQVTFVAYNPWENIYEAAENGIAEPCSDLWRRMFVWWNGLVNPCDSDYKSMLAVGKWSAGGNSLSDLWKSERYQALRAAHLARRAGQAPCNRCSVV